MAKKVAYSQTLVDIKDIQRGIVILNNGTLLKLVLVDGINFDLKSESDQTLIIHAYETMLNSLGFPTQINIHSRKINIDGYIKNLESRLIEEENELLRVQLQEYIEFIKSLIKGNAIMGRNFFVVIPYENVSISSTGIVPGKKKEKEGPIELDEAQVDELTQRTQKVIAGLRQIGLRAISLEDSELIEVYYNYYNPRKIEKPDSIIDRKGIPGIETIKDVVASSVVRVNPTNLMVSEKFSKTLFIFNFPRYLTTGWFSPIINLPEIVDISIFITNSNTGIALKNLRKKVAQIESQIQDNEERGNVRDPMLETAYNDIESLRDALQTGEEKLFDVGVYMTIYADTEKELNKLETKVINILDNTLIDVKPANFEQLKGWLSTLPLMKDRLGVHTPLNSQSLSSLFPFISLELTSDEGTMHGINRHNNTLIIFDRFSLENPNMVIFGKAGSGKSYAAKLEILRSLVSGTDVLIIDPENEYETLAKATGGSIFQISIDSKSNINPFDIPKIAEGESPSETLKSHIVDLAGLIKLMLGGVTPAEDAILDQAITETYASRDITSDSDFTDKAPPLLEDLENVLMNFDGGKDMANKLYRFTKGSYAGFVNHPTNIDVDKRLVVFSIRDLEEDLRPIAMYIILNYIWGLIRANLKRRIMVVDEAWIMMKHEDSAAFLYRLAKRSRKYYLGITTITQDVEDFLSSPYGKPVITNSTMQILLKQSPAAIDLVGKSFNLTDVEKNYLVEVDIGRGLFIAGLKHAAIQIVPSYFEDKLITTDPEEILEKRDNQNQ